MTNRGELVYAVAKGRQPGLYTTWKRCNAEVHCFSDARYKSFTSITEAKKFMRLYGAEDHADLVDETSKSASTTDIKPLLPKKPIPNPQILRIQADLPSSTPPSSFKEHWDGIALSQNLVPGSQQWKQWSQDRTVAGDRRLRELCFDGRTELEGFQELCRLVKIPWPAETIAECRSDIKSKLVNIYDLIDAVETNVKVPIWPAKEWKSFNRYDLEKANESEILSCFLQNFRRAGLIASTRNFIMSDDDECESQSEGISGVNNEGATEASSHTLYTLGMSSTLKRRRSQDMEDSEQQPTTKRPRPLTNNNSQDASSCQSSRPGWEEMPNTTSDSTRVTIEILDSSPARSPLPTLIESDEPLEPGPKSPPTEALQRQDPTEWDDPWAPPPSAQPQLEDLSE